MNVSSLFTPTKQAESCPQCGAALQIKKGKKGLFLGCSAYPQCDYLKPLNAPEYKMIKQLDECCPDCGSPLQLKQGHFGMFIGCSHYPQCQFIVSEQISETQDHLPCPNCREGNLVARCGRQGKTFYGCDRFPQCKFTVASQPHSIICPQCGGGIAIIKKQQENLTFWQCATRCCQHIFSTENEY